MNWKHSLTYFGINIFKLNKNGKQVNPSNPGTIDEDPQCCSVEAHFMGFGIVTMMMSRQRWAHESLISVIRAAGVI